MVSKIVTKTEPVLNFYGSNELVASLKRGYLPVSRDLNIVSPYLEFSGDDDVYRQPVTEQEFGIELRKQYDELPTNIRGLLSYEDFLKQSGRLEEGVKARALSNRTDNNPKYSSDRLSKLAIMRLFPSALSAFGWHVLAEDYSGLCVSLHSASAMLQSKKGKPILLRPVQYGAAHSFQATADNPLPGLFCDDSENKPRGEWRAAFSEATFSDNLVKLSNDSVQAIYFSVKAKRSMVDAVKKMIKQDLRYRSVNLYQVRPDRSNWRLVARQISCDF